MDLESQEKKEPTEDDLLTLIRLGEALPDVATVGNPVLYLRKENGERVPPRLQPIMTAAIIAKNTTKCGPTEVWGVEDLEFQIEIGIVVKESWEAYKKDPCFITAKETISPLSLPHKEGEILLALARKELPCTIIPMPLSGATSPVTSASNVAIANAEVLGVMTAIRAACPGASVAGGAISGVMDMATGNATFAGPDAILQDMALAELYDNIYGLDFGIGSGYTDAKYPGTQSVFEKTMRFMASATVGRTNYPVGLVEAGKAFSPEQAILDLEIARAVCFLARGFEVNEETLALDVIKSVGIGGNFLTEEHTILHFRKALWFPQILDRASSQGLTADMESDMLDKAHEEFKTALSAEPYIIETDKAKEIDKIVRKAGEVLV